MKTATKFSRQNSAGSRARNTLVSRKSRPRSRTHLKVSNVYFVGSYGDKTPKSILARVYASLWMIVGLILMSLITAQVSSIITSENLRSLDEEFGKKVQ